MAVQKKKIYELIEISRHYPVIGAEMLLNIKLPIHQQDMLDRVWKNKQVIFLCSRRTGKTYVMSVYALLLAVLYRNMKIGIVAPVFRQAKTVFNEVENIIKSSPFLKSLMVDEPKHTTEEWHVDFTTGGRISALPLRDSIRSYGFNAIVIDEFGFGDDMNNKLDNIIKPMLFTKRDIKIGGESHETDIGNRLVMASTATFKFNDYYSQITDFQEEIDNGSDNHDIISYDYRDGLESGIFEKELVLNEYEKADSLTKKMEYLNIFPDDNDSFISYETIQKFCIDTTEVEVDGEYVPRTTVEFEQPYDDNGNPTHDYILTFDDADVGDNFAISLIKLDGNVKRVVRVIALNNKPIQQKIKVIRELLHNFNIKVIAADQRNRNIKDNLAEPYTHPDGTQGAIILDKDDEEQHQYARSQYGDDYNYRKLIKIYNFSGRSNELRARNFLSEIENGNVKFPAPLGINSKKEEDAFNQIKKTWSEIVNIRPRAKGKYITYDTPTNSQKKDRWTVTELGTWASDEYIKKTSSGNSGNIVMGVWN